jgi:cytochrome c peroxidase
MKKVLIILALGTLLIQCRRDEDAPAHQTTPYRLNIPSTLPRASLPTDNPLTVEGVELGRKLFYDPILSIDSTISCASCHNQKLAFTDNGRRFSVGVSGQIGKRTSMPLVNLMYHPTFFWDGRTSILRQQVLEPIEDVTEMGETLPGVVAKLRRASLYREAFQKAFGTPDADPDLIAKALEQFLLIMVSGDAKFDRVQRGVEQFTASEARGFAIFNAEANPNGVLRGGDCFHCHNTAIFTTNELINNGLEPTSDLGLGALTGDPFDNFKFKTPTLRNVAVSGPYMHDGRFATLEEVIDHYDHGVVVTPSIDPNMHGSIDGLNLTSQDKEDLINFLKTLTDDAFLQNPAFSNPFKP